MSEALLRTLKSRFEKNMHRHPGRDWETVRAAWARSPAPRAALAAMEDSGGEPDVVHLEGDASAILFCDCAAESPAGRRSLCYDRAGMDARKENKPGGSAVEAAAAMGIELLSEAQYHALQGFGAFDTKTSSWLSTPKDVRALGGALFGDRRYGRVFVYHNGAQSYYAVRGFRGLVRL